MKNKTRIKTKLKVEDRDVFGYFILNAVRFAPKLNDKELRSFSPDGVFFKGGK